jgi:hypothetical protein
MARSRLSRWAVRFLVQCLLFVTGCATPPPFPSVSNEPLDVGMVALLGSPAKYSGKHVRTMGFLLVEFEGNALYLHEEDYRFALMGNAVEIAFSKAQEERFKKLSLTHVLIEGTVVVDRCAIGSDVCGARIRDVTRLDPWPSYGHR